jgi:hypothetical protein
MENLVAHRLQTLDPLILLALVQQATSDEITQITNWQHHELYGGTNGGVYRVSGTAQRATTPVLWSLILKIPPRTSSFGDPYAGTREPVAYQSGFLQQLPGRLRAPRCFGVVEQPTGEHWIWLEDTRDARSQWSLAQYGEAAFLLGQFNGAFLAGLPLPSWSWIASTPISPDFVDRFLPARAQFQAAVTYGQAQYGFSVQATTRLLEMYDQRQWYLDALDHLPSTLCHGDADRRNFLAHRMVDGEEQLVAIDWAWVGSGVVGQDASRLVNNAISFGQIAPAELGALDTIVFTNYLHGLEDAGWQGDPRLVRLGYAASMILVESLVFLGGLFVSLMDPNSHAFIIQIVGGSIDDILARARALLTYYLEVADEAQAIWATLRS